MKVSVITISYNSENFIADAIQSVLSQTHPDLEYIIVDGNSQDHTLNIIKSFGAGISKWVSEPDKGLYDALNKGISMATGEVVGFLHSDDFFANNRVIEKVSELFENSRTDSVYGDVQYVDQTDTGKILTNRKSGQFSLLKLKLGWLPPHPTFYVKRELYSKYGNFDTTFNISADYDSMLRFLGKYKISAVYSREVMVKMRVGGVSNRTMKNISKKWQEDYRAMKNNDVGNLITLFLKTMRPIAHFYKSPRYLFE
ncbi:MAG: glycosyltransferase family 2 protein [Bacteroidetes bacterium]|nr:glycosyltransferase family 2 protein [Bacteroidota bacterium]